MSLSSRLPAEPLPHHRVQTELRASPCCTALEAEPHLEVAFLAGQVEWNGLVCVLGLRVGTMLQQQRNEVCAAVQGSKVQRGRAILVGDIHTKPTDRDLCQLLGNKEDGRENS